MLKGHKDPGTVAAEIRMMRPAHSGAFLVVEGAADARFWQPRRRGDCEIVDGEGKQNVVRGVRRLDAERFGGVLGIVDDDYDSLTGVDVPTDNVVRTDAHDLECLLCRSSALDKGLAEYGDALKIRRFETTEGVDVRSALLKRALVFGRLRLAAALNDLHLDDSAIRVPRFVDRDTWAVDGDGLVRAATSGSPAARDAVNRCIARLPRADPWRVARGHDVVEVLRIGLRRVLGSVGSSVGREQISGILRAGFSPSDLRATTLWKDVRAWEAANAPFRILEN